MKHCLIINHYAQDDNGTSGARHFFLARNIEKYDWKVTIIHATFSHTHNKELSSGRFKYKNIDFIRIKTPRYSGNSVGRLFNSLIFSLRIHFSKEIKRIEKILCYWFDSSFLLLRYRPIISLKNIKNHLYLKLEIYATNIN